MTIPNESDGTTVFGNLPSVAQTPLNRPKLANILEGVSKTLKANFENISSEIQHNLSKGKERESALVRQFLELYLPNRFGLANGEMYQPTDRCRVSVTLLSMMPPPVPS